MPYSMEDFASATTTTTVQARRSRPRSLTVNVPGGLRLPVAPPSPIFGVKNEDMNTEAFPEFVDPCPPVQAEPMHCILHCKDNVCRRMVEGDIPIPPCRCDDEVDQVSPWVNTPTSKGPTFSLDDAIFETILDSEFCMDTGRDIEIQRGDIRVMLEQFEAIVVRRTLANDEFMAIVQSHAPHKPEAVARYRVIRSLFVHLSMYFERTMRGANSRKISPDELRAELKVYHYTGLSDWMSRHSNRFEWDAIMEGLYDARAILEAANFGMVGAVSKLWTECLDDVVRLLVWRNEQTAKAKAGRKVCIAGMSALVVYTIAAGIGGLFGYW